MAESTRPTGNSARNMVAWGRVASVIQSVKRMEISEDTAWTLACALKGGTYLISLDAFFKGILLDCVTWDSYISCNRSHISAKRTPHWTRILAAHPAGKTSLLTSMNLTSRVAMNPVHVLGVSLGHKISGSTNAGGKHFLTGKIVDPMGQRVP